MSQYHAIAVPINARVVVDRFKNLILGHSAGAWGDVKLDVDEAVVIETLDRHEDVVVERPTADLIVVVRQRGDDRRNGNGAQPRTDAGIGPKHGHAGDNTSRSGRGGQKGDGRQRDDKRKYDASKTVKHAR